MAHWTHIGVAETGFGMRGDRLTGNRRALGGGAAVVVLLLLAVAPAFACGGNRGTLTTSRARADVGTPIDLGGSSFQSSPDLVVNVRWGGPSGLLLAQVAPDESGAFSTRITVPAGAETGWHQISATQRQPDNTFFSATIAIEVQGAPAPTPAPAAGQATEPAPAPAQAAQPAQATPAAQAPQAAQAPAASQAAATRTVAPKAATATAPAPAAPPPAAAVPVTPEPAPAAAALAAPVTEAVAPPAAEVTPIPALPERDAVVMGGPRSVTIDSGTPLWMILPLLAVGLTLFAASCAAIVSDARQRRVTAKVKA